MTDVGNLDTMFRGFFSLFYDRNNNLEFYIGALKFCYDHIINNLDSDLGVTVTFNNDIIG